MGRWKLLGNFFYKCQDIGQCVLCGTTGKGNGQDWKTALMGMVVLQLVAVTVAVAVAPEALIA